jgi:hypothetical protein
MRITSTGRFASRDVTREKCIERDRTYDAAQD